MLHILGRGRFDPQTGQVTSWEMVGFSGANALSDLGQAQVWEPGVGVKPAVEELVVARPERIPITEGTAALSERIQQLRFTEIGSQVEYFAVDVTLEPPAEAQVRDVIRRHLEEVGADPVYMVGPGAEGDDVTQVISASRRPLQEELRGVVAGAFAAVTIIDFCPSCGFPTCDCPP